MGDETLDLVVRGGRVVTPEGIVAAEVGVRDGVVVAVRLGGGADGAPRSPGDGVPPGALPAVRVVDLADDEVLLPGLVDTHVHSDEPGRTEWEGFASVTRAAAAGGVTTLVDMPLNSIPPTVDVSALEVKRKAAEGQCQVDVGFWGGAVPGNFGGLRALHDAGVFGFKCFLLHSGVEEFPPLSVREMHEAMAEIASFDGLMIVHAEDADAISSAPPPAGRAYRDFLLSRPPDAEAIAVGNVIDGARRTGVRAHVLHLSCGGALPAIAEARRAGVRLSVETCPHYLTLSAEAVPDGATQFKCCPPIRDSANQDRLWQGLLDGTIDCIVSDHSPCTPELKALDSGDFGTAWGGISSVQLGLPVVWTEARKRGVGLDAVVQWMASGPARVAGLARKGRIAVGCDADLTVLAPDETFVVNVSRLHHRHPITPYSGRTLAGVVRRTWLRGNEVTGDRAEGRLLSRGDT